jgi:hypothetical protein
VLMTIIAGILYIAITFVGVKGLHYIGLVSVPLLSCSASGSRAIPSPTTAGRR